jgi:hypothetical protein
MPTTLAVRGGAAERADEFPSVPVLLVAFIGIALGLWGGIADETVSAEAPASFANASDGNPAKATEPAFALQTLSGFSFGP